MNESFYLFAGESFYPLGGWEDFKGEFESMSEIFAFLDKHYPNAWCCWCHVMYKSKIILEGKGDNNMNNSKWEFSTNE